MAGMIDADGFLPSDAMTDEEFMDYIPPTTDTEVPIEDVDFTDTRGGLS
jgi:hypothetical protein